MQELDTVRDWIRYAVSRFNAADVFFGHGLADAYEEAAYLILHKLSLPSDRIDVFLDSRVTQAERAELLQIIERRVDERIPAAYLTHEAWLGGFRFYVDERVIIPRSFIAELLPDGLAPWIPDAAAVQSTLDLCTGSGCIGIAMAAHNPEWRVDLADISDDALALARENIQFQNVEERVRALKSDLFAGLKGQVYDLIVSNPPYVTEQEFAALPAEYAHEPSLGLKAGDDGLDFALRILAEAPAHLSTNGWLIVEVGESERALVDLLPRLPLNWIEFEVGQMGVFAIERGELVKHAKSIRAALAGRGQKRKIEPRRTRSTRRKAET